MIGWAWAALCFLGAPLLLALSDLVSEEIRGWLDLAPQGILRLAAAQLDAVQYENIYKGEWLPELQYILKGAESRPITRLIRGVNYALGLLISARRIARQLDRAPEANSAPRESFRLRLKRLAKVPVADATGDNPRVGRIRPCFLARARQAWIPYLLHW